LIYQKKKRNNFQITYDWPKRILKNYKNVFNRNIFFKKEKEFLKKRFDLNFLLCLLRGINSNYEEKVDFTKKRINIFRHSSIYLALITIRFLNDINKNG
tara:strand:- start:202 stop:498 length:297 start_codon:yes stop_codon:yes gene_type:complete